MRTNCCKDNNSLPSPTTLCKIIENRFDLSSQIETLKSNKTIKRNNKAVAALNLPTVININPRSVYNKVDEFHEMMEQYSVDLCLMSGSWERENLKLDKIIRLENFEIITNVVQRKESGGKPAIIVNSEKYFVKRLCPEHITVPIGIEIVWALLTPKLNQGNLRHKIKNIAVASIYSKPRSRKKSILHDHIAETLIQLSQC